MKCSGAVVVAVLAGSLVAERSADACHIGTELPVPVTSEGGELLGFGVGGRF